MASLDIAIDAVLAGILVWVAREDLRRFRIPNRAVLALALLFVAACAVRGRADLLLPHGLYALAILAALAVAFALGALGGGDAKLLAVALLWLGPEATFVFALLLLAAVLAYALGARLRLLPARRSGGRTRIPFGPCVAAAWLGTLALGRLLL